MAEARRRSIIKGISWRVFATLTTAVLVYIFTSSFALSLSISLFEFISKLVLYYVHERAWNRVGWGQKL